METVARTSRLRRIADAAGIEPRLFLFLPLSIAMSVWLVALLPLLASKGNVGEYAEWIAFTLFLGLGSLVVVPVTLPAGLAGWVLAHSISRRFQLRKYPSTRIAGMFSPVMAWCGFAVSQGTWSSLSLPVLLAPAIPGLIAASICWPAKELTDPERAGL